MLLGKLISIWELNADQVDSELKKTERQTKSAKDSIGKLGESGVKKFAALRSAALGFFGAALSVGKALHDAVQRAGEISALDALSKNLGIAIDDTDALSRSIQSLGASSGAAEFSLDRLAEAFGESADPMGEILRLSDEIASVDYHQASRRLRDLGISDSSTIEFLRKGSDEIQRMTSHQKANGAVTKEAAARAFAFNDALTKLRGGARDASNSLSTAILPVLTKIVTWLERVIKFARENERIVTGALIAISAIVAAVYVPAMASAAVATIAATWPLILIGAAIAAAAALFVVLYDDVMAFIQGNDSLIGSLLETYPAFRKIVEAAISAVVIAWEWLQVAIAKVWEWLKIAFKGIGMGVGLLVDGWILQFKALVSGVQWAWDKLKKLFGLIGKGVDKIKGAVNWVSSKLGGGQELSANVSSVQEIVATAAASPANDVTSRAIQNVTNSSRSSEQNVSIGSVTIETQATDAVGVAGALSGELEDQLERLRADTDSPFVR